MEKPKLVKKFQHTIPLNLEVFLGKKTIQSAISESSH